MREKGQGFLYQQNGDGFLLDGEGRKFLLDKMPLKTMNEPNFNDALKRLCEVMGLTQGTIVEEGQMTACPVHYTHTSQEGNYASQIVGTVLGTSREVVCNLLVVHTIPVLKSKTFTYIGRWDQNQGEWSFGEE